MTKDPKDQDQESKKPGRPIGQEGGDGEQIDQAGEDPKTEPAGHGHSPGGGYGGDREDEGG